MNLFDNYDFESFHENLKETEKNTKRSLNVIKSLKLTPIKTSNDGDVRFVGSIGRKNFEVTNFALSSLEERAGVTGSALSKLSTNQYSRIINTCLRTAKKGEKSLIVLHKDKIMAFLSEGYRVIPIDEIFSLVNEEMINKGGKFTVGSVDEFQASAEYALPLSITKGNEDIVPANYKPVVFVQTSNVGLSGANIFPYLSSKGVTIPIGAPLCLQHKGEANIEKFKENVEKIYSLFSKSLEDLRKLKDISIEYPVECLTSVCKKYQIPKKYFKTAITFFEDSLYDDEEVTAYDLYMALTEIIYIAEGENKTQSSLLSLKEHVARCLKANWKEYDIPTVI